MTGRGRDPRDKPEDDIFVVSEDDGVGKEIPGTSPRMTFLF